MDRIMKTQVTPEMVNAALATQEPVVNTEIPTPRVDDAWGGLLHAYPHLEKPVEEMRQLERELAEARSLIDDITDSRKMAIAERDKLRARLEKLCSDYADAAAGETEMDELVKLRDENGRLREALTDAVRQITPREPKSAGMHSLYVPQIGTDSVKRWKEALKEDGK